MNRKLTSNLWIGFEENPSFYFSHTERRNHSLSQQGSKWWTGIGPESSSNFTLTSSDMAKPQIARQSPDQIPDLLTPIRYLYIPDT